MHVNAIRPVFRDALDYDFYPNMLVSSRDSTEKVSSLLSYNLLSEGGSNFVAQVTHLLGTGAGKCTYYLYILRYLRD